MITILIADDHLLFREGIHRLIDDWTDFEVVGEARNGQEALEMCQKFLPDIVLMDVHMPEMNGVEATAHIRNKLPGTRIVMLTVSENENDLFEAIKNGAQGYILKDVPSKRLHDLLRGVIKDEAPLSGAIAAKMLSEFNRWGQASNNPTRTFPDERTEPLSERETEILRLITAGLSNTEIAEKLVVSEQTVKKHLHNILGKLQLNNRVQAAVYAVRKGLVK